MTILTPKMSIKNNDHNNNNDVTSAGFTGKHSTSGKEVADIEPDTDYDMTILTFNTSVKKTTIITKIIIKKLIGFTGIHGTSGNDTAGIEPSDLCVLSVSVVKVRS